MDNKCILVVEDEQTLLEAIKNKCEVSCFQVITARSVDQALNSLSSNQKIDVIWLDHYLFGQENGLDLVGKLKSEESAWKNIPIYVVSNTANNDKVQSYLQLGVERFFVKSNFRLDQIIEQILNILNNGEPK